MTHSSHPRPEQRRRNVPRPTLILLVALILLTLCLTLFGWWRGAGVGPQVQVPMFYDDHYLYPRPWTQEQEAPGVPAPAPVALYGPNRISQSFVSAAANLHLIELWLSGPAGRVVEVTLTGGSVMRPATADEAGGTVGRPATAEMIYGGTITLEEGAGQFYRVALPEREGGDRGRSFTLTLTAPNAAAEQPVIVRTVGGDRLGSSLRLNEYRQPGNLELYTYGQGWLNSLGEQLLPAVFRLRLQQYKPDFFKGTTFTVLLGVTGIASLAFLLLTLVGDKRPHAKTKLFYLALGLWVLFLGWQWGSGRVLIPFFLETIPLQNQSTALSLAPAPDGTPRLMQDFSQTLWTAYRFPEPRFVSTELVAGWPALVVPAPSALEYPLTIPPDGWLHLGLAVRAGDSLRFNVRFGETVIHTQTVPKDDVVWLDLDLQAWAGQAGVLILETEGGDAAATGLWLMPQLLTASSWLLADAPSSWQAAGERFGEAVELAGYQVETAGGEAVVTLYWRVVTPTDAYATVFVHLLDASGNIVAQHDGAPVNGSYPIPLWQPGVLIADTHRLTLPAESTGPYQLAVGLYDPVTLLRWPVTSANGEPLPDGRAVLEGGENN